MKNTIIRLSTCTLIFLLFFCGIFRHDTQQSAVISLASEKQFDCVARVIENNKTVGSGVLIAPRYVLSAAHILLSTTQLFTKNKKAENVDPADFQFEFRGTVYHAKRFIIHPDFLKNGLASGTDLLLVELEKPVSGITPATLNGRFDEVGTLVTGVGYGISGIVTPKGMIKPGTEMGKTAGRNIVDELGGKMVSNQPSMLLFDFDSPDNPGLSKMGSSTPVELEYSTSGGDSGGGLFRQKNKTWELIGILHSSSSDMGDFRKNGYYGQVSKWTRVSAFKDWIETVDR